MLLICIFWENNGIGIGYELVDKFNYLYGRVSESDAALQMVL
ncbi:hypothetical protein [Niallia sp. 03091]